MEHSGLFQEAVELILNSNDKFTNRLQKNSVFGSSEDSDELTKLTQCISYVMKTFFEADEYNAVSDSDEPIPTWRTGCKLDENSTSYVYLMYMPCEGEGNGIMRIEHYIYHGDNPVHQLAYMIIANQNPSVAKYTGWKVREEDTTPDWEF